MSSSFFPTIKRIIKLGLTNFWRNRWLTLGATLLMTLTLTMISVSILMTYLLRDTAALINSKIDLTIYFRDDTVVDNSITALMTRIQGLPDVTSARFVDKAAALAIWDRLPINENIKKPVTATNNTLPRSIEISTNSPDSIQSVVDKIGATDTDKIICTECVSYSKNKDTVNRLISITKFVQRAGLVLSMFFGLIAIFNVMNIIRITITARSDEIEIMRYVGASNAFVRGPFIVEGILYGLFGTIFTTLFLLAIGYGSSYYAGTSSGALSFLQMINLDIFQYVLAHLFDLVLIQLGIGVLLGIVVSSLSIRRFLEA